MIKDKSILKKLTLIPFVSTLFIVVGLINGSPVFASPKISLSPSPIALNIGSSQVVTVSLSEPIICEDPYIPCNTGLIFTSSDPTNITISPSSLSFSPSSWYAPQQITITSVNNGQYGNENVTISSTAISASEYYSGFPVSLSGTVNNTNEPPAPAVNQTASVTNNSNQSSSVVYPLAPDTGYGTPTNNSSGVFLVYLIITGLIGLSAGTRKLSKATNK